MIRAYYLPLGAGPENPRAATGVYFELLAAAFSKRLSLSTDA